MVLNFRWVVNYEECLFVFCNIGAVIVNKYVLSTLHFTIPTVFQGWQTFVCVVLLTALMKWSRFQMDIQLLDRKYLTRMIFPMLCFSLSNVAGSKALAELPVAIFLAGTNVIPAGLTILDYGKLSLSGAKIVGCVALSATVLALYVFYSSGHKSGWLWLSVHVVAQQALILTLSNLRLASVTTTYYCNFSSVLILLPLSIYMQEASSALHHARHASTEFFLGCLLSGVLGTGLQVLSGSMRDRGSVPLYQGVSKILACSLSILFFPYDMYPIAWLLIVMNLVTGCFLFLAEEKRMEDVLTSEILVI